MDNKTTVKPETEYIDDLISNISSGKYCVPAFQRGYVWNKPNIIELFDSIYNGFPIGSVLLWDTELKIKVYDSFGNAESSKESLYVLDGQQRLTTLYNCLSGSSHEDELWNVYMDLKERKFLHVKAKETLKPEYFPVSKLINTMDFLKESKRVIEETGNERLMDEAERLANTIRKYKLSTIQLIGGDIDSAIEIFTRLNRTGVEILSIDIIKALNYQEDGDGAFNKLSDTISEILERFNFVSEGKKDKLNSDVIIRVIRVASGYQLYAKNDTVKLSHHIRSDDFSNSCNKIINAFEETIAYFKTELKFDSYDELPYSSLLYMVFAHFYFSAQRGFIPNSSALEKNIYVGSITEAYAGSPSVTEKLILYFKSNFDQHILTKKLLEQFSKQSITECVDKQLSSGYKSQSAAVKIMFNLYKRAVGGHLAEELQYPPSTLYPDIQYKDRFGNKVFDSPKNTKIYVSENIEKDIQCREEEYFRIFENKYSDYIA